MVLSQDSIKNILILYCNQNGVLDRFAEPELERLTEIVTDVVSKVVASTSVPVKEDSWITHLKEELLQSLNLASGYFGVNSLGEILELDEFYNQAYEAEFDTEAYITKYFAKENN